MTEQQPTDIEQVDAELDAHSIAHRRSRLAAEARRLHGDGEYVREVHEVASLMEDMRCSDQRYVADQELMASLIERFRKPETAGIDWDLLRDGKLRAWPIPPFHR